MTQSELQEQVKLQANAIRNDANDKETNRHWLVAVLVGVLVLVVLLAGIRSRVKAASTLKAVTAQTAVPSISVVLPKQTASAQEIILPGNVQPFITSPIYARTDGYLQRWYFDIGAHVKKGDLLAVIETPEVDQELEQARGTLATAQANSELARITRDRYQGLLTKHAVAQQDVDNAVGTYNANKAIVDADLANLQRYAALVSFEKVYSPIDGVVTARNTDIGDLINSGSSSASRTDLFHLAQTGTLRVYVNVPEEYSRAMMPGHTNVDIALAEFPGETFPGNLVRTAEAINATTRTLLIEVDVANPKGTLLTGSYAEVHLKVPARGSTFLIPVNTLIFRTNKLQVGIVRDGKTVITDITPGHDFGEEIEVVAGLTADDRIVLNPSDSLVSGEEVKIVDATLPGDSR